MSEPQLSVVVPAHNEELMLPPTVEKICSTLTAAGISHELIVVDDHSTDGTWTVLQELGRRFPTLRPVSNTGPNGFGNAIRFGLDARRGDRATVMMADLSDDPNDLVCFMRTMDRTGADCVFGSRVMRGAAVTGYPKAKWVMNRLANWFLCVVFQYRYGDTTNPFKLYTDSMLQRMAPLRSTGFELEIEMPLKAMIRGARYVVVPNSWTGREAGESKMRLGKLIGPYLRVTWECLHEKWMR